jgi:fumarate reductase iron-sulfur subunit
VNARLVELDVLRYDPEADSEPHFQRYSVPCAEEWFVLDALNAVKENIDPTLNYRWSCHMAVCGSCGMMINGEPKLSCHAFLRDYAGVIRVEPLANFPIERHLVTVADDFIDKLKRVKPYLIPARNEPVPEGEYKQTPAQLMKYRQFSMCINCMLCSQPAPNTHCSRCSSVRPRSRWRRYNLDSRDGGRDERQEVIASNAGVWECSFVGACSEVCPSGDPAAALQRRSGREHDRLVQGTSCRGRGMSQPIRSQSLDDRLYFKQRAIYYMSREVTTIFIGAFALLLPLRAGTSGGRTGCVRVVSCGTRRSVEHIQLLVVLIFALHKRQLVQCHAEGNAGSIGQEFLPGKYRRRRYLFGSWSRWRRCFWREPGSAMAKSDKPIVWVCLQQAARWRLSWPRCSSCSSARGAGTRAVLRYAQLHAFAAHWFGKLFVLAVIALFLWHAAHRLRVTLHDFGLRQDAAVAVVVYVIAAAGTLMSVLYLLRI